jgi:hypothetical protein
MILQLLPCSAKADVMLRAHRVAVVGCSRARVVVVELVVVARAAIKGAQREVVGRRAVVARLRKLNNRLPPMAPAVLATSSSISL